ncbi:MAG: 30S ribosomal protein S12 methylthiotransferase RimO [Bacteroidetes bacterium]|nr:30S ribosomal protein S12 methylthiotransferase RimO [Bacteroidota bacterium]
MRTKTSKQKTVNVVTLGCSKNLVDSEVLMGQLKANDFDVVHEAKRNNQQVVIVNTCGFIDNAKQESIDTILYYAEQKQKGAIEKLIVTGCLSERYKPELEKEIPDVDHFFGTHDLPVLLKTLGADYKHELVGERLLTTPRHYSYLKISEGCDRPCAFCAIPVMRGKHVSKPLEQIIAETKNLVASGTKELLLIAQDATFYGLDIYKKRALANLLATLSDVDGLEWIRLHYAYPSAFPLEVLDVMRERNNICNYIDIPLQHGSNNMLKAMRRGITREKTEELIDTIRNKVPDIAIRTTMIAGFPGETQADHDEQMRFIEQMQFDRLGVFAYSHEEHTHAYSLPDNVTAEVKQQRVDEIMELQQGISHQINQRKCNKTYKVLVDRKEGNYFIGRTEFDSPEVDNEVLIDATKAYLRRGHFANIKITKAEAFDLYGEVAVR